MDNAQVYMSLIRPTGIPVAGECAADIPFTGQVELHGWSWTLFNLDEKRRAKNAAKPYTEKASLLDSQHKAKSSRDLQRKLHQLNRRFEGEDAMRTMTALNDKKRAGKLTKAEEMQLESLTEQVGKDWTKWNDDTRDKLKKFEQDMDETLDPSSKRQTADQAREERRNRERQALDEQIEDANEEKNYEFSFSKRVDLATTQLLNSMKSGDIFPTGVLTIHQSSANAGLSLVITVQKLRLIDYALKVEVSETMTDMREEWTAQFASLAYVYKNRKSITKSSDAGQAVAKAASQGTVRMFTMKNIGSPI
jgi:type VI protein secretion system component Hcp